MDKKLVVSPSPHIHGKESTARLMLDVIIALIPALLVSIYVFGWSALAVTLVSVASCVLFEFLIQKFMLRGPVTVNNFSAIVTGILLAFNLPSSIPLWIVMIGALVAIGIGKMTFGGLGKNPFNPALVGRVFLLLSFPVAMTSFPAVADAVANNATVVTETVTAATGATITDAASLDALSGATPLTVLKAGVPTEQISSMFCYRDLLFGFHGGSLGEVSALALLLGFIWLLIRRVITWHIPVFVLGTIAVFSGVMHLIDSAVYADPLFHVLTGGAILGAVFMATDYVTSPMTRKGMLIFGIGIGALTVIIRIWGSYPEGMSFAILIMNAFVPLIDKLVKPRRFGAIKKGRA